MCSVCTPRVPVKISLKISRELEASEDYSIEDDSSCSISGTESPTHGMHDTDARRNSRPSLSHDVGELFIRHTKMSSSLNNIECNLGTNDKYSGISKSSMLMRSPVKNSHSSMHICYKSNSASDTSSFHSNGSSLYVQDISTETSLTTNPVASNPSMFLRGAVPRVPAKHNAHALSTLSFLATLAAFPKAAIYKLSSGFVAVATNTINSLKYAVEVNLIYIGIILTAVLAGLSAFLFYRLLDIEAKTNLYSPNIGLLWHSEENKDIYREVLRWQEELLSRSAKEAQNVVDVNLEQVAKVRRNLEALSTLFRGEESAADMTSYHNGD